MEAEICRRGLIKLMLRMPALRSELQLLSVRNDDVRSLCGAFEEAQMTLERLRRDAPNTAQLFEYEHLCDEIENDILSICSLRA